MFQVIRHGGRSNSSWKVILCTNNKAKALDTYIAVGQVIRRGQVKLLEDGNELFGNEVAGSKKV